MRVGRVSASIVGIVAIIAWYLTSYFYFLVVAVIAFIVGLYIMGAKRRPRPREGRDELDSKRAK